LANQSANPEHVQVRKEVDNTVVGRQARQHVEANEKRRDEQWVGKKSQDPSAGGGALANLDQRKSKTGDTLTHKVYKKGRLPVLAKTLLENPGVFTDPFDAFVVATSKQLSVKYYYTAVIDTVKKEEKSGIAADAINWQVAFDLEDVQVGHLAKMYKVNIKDIWPPMQSATHVATWGKEGGGLSFEVWVATSSTAVSAHVRIFNYVVNAIGNPCT